MGMKGRTEEESSDRDRNIEADIASRRGRPDSPLCLPHALFGPFGIPSQGHNRCYENFMFAHRVQYRIGKSSEEAAAMSKTYSPPCLRSEGDPTHDRHKLIYE